MIFCWHFLHGTAGAPIGLAYEPTVFPLALLDEGHTGVALFMTLSGYLFAKLLQDRKISYASFLWNRMLRIAPLLLLVVFGIGVHRYLTDELFGLYVYMVAWGWLLPTLPNGAWSVTVELHFYLLLPLILLLARRSQWWLPAIVACAIALRIYLHAQNGEVQSLAYLTLVGRIDQFLLGILAYRYRHWLTGRHLCAFLAALAFMAFYAWFDRVGGYSLYPAYPSTSPLWIFMPDIEGMAYALLIAYYDSSFQPRRSGLSALVGHFGTYSYSLYLLHFFVVFKLSAFIDAHVMDLSNFYVACAWALLCFMMMYPIGYLSYRFIEAPFLKLRRRYAEPLPPAFQATIPAPRMNE